MKIYQKCADSEEITARVAEAMESCGIEVFSITHNGKVFHVWGKSGNGVDVKTLDRKISELILQG